MYFSVPAGVVPLRFARTSTFTCGLPSMSATVTTTPSQPVASVFGQEPKDDRVPATWQSSRAEHGNGSLPTHAPLWQTSLVVHHFPSSQDWPSLPLGQAHAPAAPEVLNTHVPLVHWLLAAQL